jgi:hypothetical protein
MEVYLPIAGMSVNVFLILGMGVLVGFLSGLFGVGGGFLLTPLLIMIGIPPAVAAASDSNQIVASSSSGAYSHKRMGNVDMRMGIVILIGGIAGSTIGVQVVKVLRQMGNFDFVLKAVYVVVLGGIGSYMLIESLKATKGTVGKEKKGESCFRRLILKLPLKMEFRDSGIKISVIFPLIMGLIVGFLAALMGVGGGFIMVPAMIYILGMPTIKAIGTDLFQIVFTSISATVQQAIFNHTVDIGLALLLLFGSTIGAQFGVRAGRRLKGKHLRILLAAIVLIVMMKMLYELIAMPSNLIGLTTGESGH